MDILENQDEFESLEKEIPASAPAQQQEELPEKYRGKSASEIARMHQEAERLISRQGQEVAEVRRLADQLIQQSLQAPRNNTVADKPEPKDSLDEVDFFSDPKQAVAKAVAAHPAVVNAQMMSLNLARQESLRNLKENHPDFKEVVSDEEFREWVGKSKVRQQLFLAADRNYNFDAADELISTFKALKGHKAQETQEEVQRIRETQERSLNAASNPAVGGSSEPTGKKIYRRADLIRLNQRDPARYEQMQDEIMRAYQEGRVR